jgi:methyl-accepting chemotaxis protein
MSKISLSLKIIACFLGLLIVSIVSSGIALVSMNRASVTAENVAQNFMALNSISSKVETEMAGAVLNTREYMLATKNAGDLADYDAAQGYLTQALADGTEMVNMMSASDDEFSKSMLTQAQSALTGMEDYRSRLEQSKQLYGTLFNNNQSANEHFNILYKSLGQYVEFINATMADPAAYNRMIEISKRVGTMQAETRIVQNAVINAVYTRDPSTLKAADATLQDIVAKAAEVKAMAVLPRSQELIEEVDAGAAQIAKDIISVENTLDTLKGHADMQTNIRMEFSKTIAAVSSGANDATVAGSTDLYKMLTSTSRIIIFFVVLVIIVGAVSLVFINFSVVRKLKDFVGMVGNFTSGDGDLTKRIPVTSEDEIGQLAKNVNMFVESIQDIIQQVKNASDDVASGNTQLAATMEELSTTFNSQSEQVNSVALNMSGISNTSQNVVMSLADNITKMQESNEAIENGNSKLQEVMGTMRNMKRQSETLGETISNLVQSSSKIGEILSVINDVADQTNLLALNAAIEAARAGDAGRGFAVVADEVRKLAERTQRSTSEISQIITTLQKDSGMASSEMAKTAEGVNTGMEGIQATSQLFETVVEAVGDVSSATSKVNEEVNQQYEMTNSVTDNTQAIASGVEESVHVVNEVSSTVTHLQKQAETLKAIVAQFKV